MHPSSASRADPQNPQKPSSVMSLVGGGGGSAAKKQRRALSDASNVVVAESNASKSRPNSRNNNGRKNAPNAMMMMESTLCKDDVCAMIKEKRAKVLDALLDELDGDCA